METEDRPPVIGMDPIGCRTVSFAKVETGQTVDRQLDMTAEEFEIGIGSWRAKIVKQFDGKAGRPSFMARFDIAPREVWARRRLQRLADRLNARRRPSD